VLCDHLNAEYPTKFIETTDDYLVLASAAGFGAYERGDPWANTYSLIDYQKIEL
jgi:hypothetical protein